MLKKFFLNLLSVIKYRLLEIVKNIRKKDDIHVKVKIGDKVGWIGSFKISNGFIVKNYGSGPFKVLGIEKDSLMAYYTVNKNGKQVKRTPLLIKIRANGGKYKGKIVLLEDDLFFKGRIYIDEDI